MMDRIQRADSERWQGLRKDLYQLISTLIEERNETWKRIQAVLKADILKWSEIVRGEES